MIEACPGEACRLPCGAVVRLKKHGSVRVLNPERMNLALSMLSRDDLVAEGAVSTVLRAIALARNVPGKAIHIFDDPGRKVQGEIPIASDQVIEHAKNYRDACALVTARRIADGKAQAALKQTMTDLENTVVKWIRHDEIPAITWSSPFVPGEDHRFHVQVRYRVKRPTLTKKLLAGKVSEAIMLAQSATNLSEMPVCELRHMIGDYVLQSIAREPSTKTPYLATRCRKTTAQSPQTPQSPQSSPPYPNMTSPRSPIG